MFLAGGGARRRRPRRGGEAPGLRRSCPCPGESVEHFLRTNGRIVAFVELLGAGAWGRGHGALVIMNVTAQVSLPGPQRCAGVPLAHGSREELQVQGAGANYCTPEITNVTFHWTMSRRIHWKCPVNIHWTSDNPLEHTAEHPRCFLRCRFLACNIFPLKAPVHDWLERFKYPFTAGEKVSRGI